MILSASWIESPVRQETFFPDITSLTAGVHQLGVRARDATTNWSVINWLPVTMPDTPVVLLNGQYYSNNVVVTTNGASFSVQLQCRYVNPTMFYTTDGSDPNGGATYSGPFNISPPFSIRVVAYNEDFSLSAMSDNVVSLSVATAGGGSLSNSILLNVTNGITTTTLTAIPFTGWSFIHSGR